MLRFISRTFKLDQSFYLQLAQSTVRHQFIKFMMLKFKKSEASKQLQQEIFGFESQGNIA